MYFEERGYPNSCWSTLTLIEGKIIICKSLLTSNCLVFHLLQNSMYVQQKKETHSGLKPILSKGWYNIKHWQNRQTDDYWRDLITCKAALQRLYRKKRFTNNLELNDRIVILYVKTKQKKELTTLDWKIYSCFNRNQSICFIFIFVHSISWMLC